MKYFSYIFIFLFISLSACHKIANHKDYGMLPNINFGDKVIIKKTADNTYDYGDAIVFDSGQGFLAILRVVGLPEDSIAMDDQICIINGKKNKWRKTAENISYETIRVPHTAEEMEEEFPNGIKVRLYKETKFLDRHEVSLSSIDTQYIPEGHYFVLGDVRTVSIDSRDWGSIPVKNIKGKVVKIIKE